MGHKGTKIHMKMEGRMKIQFSIGSNKVSGPNDLESDVAKTMRFMFIPDILKSPTFHSFA